MIDVFINWFDTVMSDVINDNGVCKRARFFLAVIVITVDTLFCRIFLRLRRLTA